ncbi:MAG: hypothetical protein O3C40_22110 [Planctomycetota bacterium]|nr:hypothetical protein [Planctomycetota bacterium]
MSTKVTCRQCQSSFAAPPHLYGKTVACPKCRAPIAIPQPVAPAPNPQLHFHEVRRADHFSILAPVTPLMADKIRQDTGPSCNIQFTDEEIGSRF